jgi:hypothetical protein
MDRTLERSVLRDALDRANEEFRRTTVEFQAAIQSPTDSCSDAETELRVRRASRIHAEAGDALLLALTRFEAFVLGQAAPAELKRCGAEAARAGSRLN